MIGIFVPHNLNNLADIKNILEVGCGTGQMSMYFCIGSNNNIVGLDPTIESLESQKFFKKNEISNLTLVNADILDDVLKDNFFDFIWCNGVLHHTKNPYKAFEMLIKSLKRDGYVLIGLYNKIGELELYLESFFINFLGKIY